jgi:hypothetical protein
MVITWQFPAMIGVRSLPEITAISSKAELVLHYDDREEVLMHNSFARYIDHKTVEISPEIQPNSLKPIDGLSVLPE